ncbi:MAG TPA: ATP-binding protein [Candidatus Saccharimonadales bacterium]|nr:ATP-binding protein [Candidatus Saccharimonadales bacterium]
MDRFSVRTSPGVQCLAADMDGDSSEDLLYADSSRILCNTFSSGIQRARFDLFLQPRRQFWGVWDVRGDGKPKVLLSSFDGHAFWLECLDPLVEGEAQRLYRVGPFMQGCRPWKNGQVGGIEVIGCLDLKGDGRPALFVHSYPMQPGGPPRRIACLDGPTGRQLWAADETDQVTGVTLLTRRRGAERHVLVTTYAPSNGFEAGGESDSKCYVESFSPAGRREWIACLGGEFAGTTVAVLDVDDDGEADIVATAGLSGAAADSLGTGVRRLVLLDPKLGRVIRSVPIPATVSGCIVEDVDGDGQPEILAHGQDQALYCFDHRLNLRWSSRERPIAGILGVADLDGDGRLEVVCSGETTVLALDDGGRLRAEWEARRPLGGASLIRLRPRPCVLAFDGDDLRILALEPPTVSPAALATLVGLTALGGAAWAYLARRRRRAELLVELDEAQDRLLTAMVAFGHGGASLAILDRLRLHLGNWDRLRAQGGAREALAPVLDDFVSTVLPDLVRLVSLARRAMVRSQHWRYLAQQALLASGQLQQFLEGGSDQPDAHMHRALAALDQVDASLKALRAHLRQVCRTPLEPLVRKVLARRQEALAEAGVEVREEIRCPEGHAAFVAPHELEKVLDGLVENAARAMQGCATRQLTVSVDVEGAHCRITVGDTGRGIPAGDWERVFDRDYSTRDGGGFGLYYARQALARYEGKVHVDRSGPGEGTTFRVLLRAA